MAPLRVPTYPDVPQASGVPAVFRAPTQPVFTAVLLLADVASVIGMFLPSQWGIFHQDGAPVAIPDSVVSVDFRREWRISDYPTERGGFQSFDKVATPFDIRVRFATSGFGFRGNFLSAINAAATSLELFDVVTPDAVYENVNIVHYDYRRERQNGVGIILVDVWCEQVRATATTTFTSTKAPEGAATQNSGTVQPSAPTPAQAAAATGSGPGFGAALQREPNTTLGVN